MPAPQVSVQEADQVIGVAQLVARFLPGTMGADVRKYLEWARTNEAFVADVTPIIEDAITVNIPIANRLAAAIRRHPFK